LSVAEAGNVVNRVRAFRLLVLAPMFLVLGAIALTQGDWITAGFGLLGAVFSVLLSVGVEDRTEAEKARAGGWRRMEPYRSPFMDYVLLLMVGCVAVVLILNAQPA
jgi:hypothetical protein